jgi:hypothetical protein
MNLLKNIIKKQDTLLELELSISNKSTCKLIHRDPENDLDIMLACTLFYVKVLKQMSIAERNAITRYFLGLDQHLLEMNTGYVELSLSTVPPENLRSEVSIKLITDPVKGKELRFSKLKQAILYQYILLFFKFTLGNISTVYRQSLISTFLSLSRMDQEEGIIPEEIEITANKILLCFYHDAA